MNDPNVILFRLDSIEVRVQEQGKMLAEVRDHIIKTPICPRPGLCIDIQGSMLDYGARIQRLEKREAWIIGACTTASVLVGALLKLL